MKYKIYLIISLMFLIGQSKSQNMKKIYKKEVSDALNGIQNQKPEILTEQDMAHLPIPVQKYLRYTGCIGQEKVFNFRVEMEGGIRSSATDSYMKLKSVQYNFVANPSRFFYIKAKKMGIPVGGVHIYKNETAYMTIKLAGLFTVVDAHGKEMDQGETVTLFNDMCFMAPATLISPNIEWETIDTLTVKAIYTNGNQKIIATLYFNEEGQLIDFISHDRYETSNGVDYYNYPWQTPVKGGYQQKNGRMFPCAAEAIYIRPEGAFCYAEFKLINIEYNLKNFKNK